jgi:hypothetical protein
MGLNSIGWAMHECPCGERTPSRTIHRDPYYDPIRCQKLEVRRLLTSSQQTFPSGNASLGNSRQHTGHANAGPRE